jgi:sirohydrochlorin cobaltochelatase
MADRPKPRGIILLAHGARDPLWSQPIEAVAARARQLDALALVECAYLELMQPDLLACADNMAKAGVQRATVVPLFLGVGKHAREDMPRLMALIRTRHPNIVFGLQPAIGEDPRMVELMASIALA